MSLAFAPHHRWFNPMRTAYVSKASNLQLQDSNVGNKVVWLQTILRIILSAMVARLELPHAITRTHFSEVNCTTSSDLYGDVRGFLINCADGTVWALHQKRNYYLVCLQGRLKVIAITLSHPFFFRTDYSYPSCGLVTKSYGGLFYRGSKGS